ncbi:prephenate dehydratase [Actinotignum timonense]|uniref:prephenate dehydratase n=1 Tax=Actinotignum TaxID=1653174 RepID=UPI0025513425|nr:prephenate dehydratase [Actinotignum timonense]MDK6591003.1 prephenate dehydratase [Actinotignum timonense]MDK6629226.1 prephenate dehydratase [Actinotignum timonense]MDK6905641.1 prephenate dehydratase [Actinotignum timonense]MDK8783056.1 prephenate dehydratase [Actinotignum timonense]
MQSSPATEPVRYSFLGPRGTFCFAALQQVASEDTATFVPAVDVPSALRMVRAGQTDAAVVPIENSVEGGVNATLDSLTAGSPLEIRGEMLVPIAFSLAVRPGTRAADIRRVATHPHAWAQCRTWITEHLTDAVHVPATSTAAAARELAENPDADFDAAICAVPTTGVYGLASLSDEIADNRNAVTRFIKVSKPGEIPPATGSDKTTLMVRLASEKPGALLEMLQQFAAVGVNLSRIESRPAGDQLGRYAFSLDAEGHIHDERVQAALVGLHRICPEVTFLGSYARADRQVTRLHAGTSDEDFGAARTWVASLLSRVTR